MSEEGVTPQEAKAIKKKITMTMMMIIIFSIGAGAALFFVTAPAHAFGPKSPDISYDKLGDHLKMQTVAKRDDGPSLGESIDFTSTLLSLRSRAAQENLNGSYRPIRPTYAENNIEVNRSFDAPLAPRKRKRAEVIEIVDNTLVKKGEEEKKLDEEAGKGGSGGTIRDGAPSGEGAARIASIAKKLGEEYQEIMMEIAENVGQAEKLWREWVGGDRSATSNRLLDDSKSLLVEAREKYRLVRASNLNISALDYVGSYISTMIYDINKVNTGSDY